MKISFLGSTNVKCTKRCLEKLHSFEPFIFCGESGIEEFYNAVASKESFYNNIKGSEVIIVDGFINLYSGDIDENTFINFYQKLFWYLLSLCPHAKIYLISYSHIKRTSSHSYHELLTQLKCIKNVKVFISEMFPDPSYYDDSYLEDICSQILKDINVPQIDPGSRLSKVIENLKSKKEFETKCEQV